MRIRTIKPEWLDDERLVLASSEARVLSIALILLADDYGNGRASPTILAGRVFPGSANPRETLAKALGELASLSFVVLYEVDGQSYFAIRNWEKHQRVDKPGRPQVPPPTNGNAVISARSEDSANIRETHAKVPESLATDQDQEGTRKGEDQERAREVDHAHVVRVYSQLRSEAHQAKTGNPGGTYRRTTRDWQPVEDLVAWAREQSDPAATLEDSLRGYLADEWATGAGWPISTWAKDPGRYNGRFQARGGTNKAAEALERAEVATREARLAYEACSVPEDRARLRAAWDAAKATLRAARDQVEQTRGAA